MTDQIGIHSKKLFYDNQYSFFDYKDKTVVGVGAQTGDSVLYFFFRGARRVIAFEPLSKNFEILKNNVELNALNCECYDIALGSENKKRNVTYFGDMVNAFGHGEATDIEMKRLDDYELNPDIIKIDVEGFEIDVLKGAFQTLRRTKEIIIEVHSLMLRSQVVELLTSLDFKIIKEDKKNVDGFIANQFWVRK